DTADTEIYTLSLHDALPICTLSANSITGKLKQGAQELELNVEKGEYVAVTPTLSLTEDDYAQLAGRWTGQLGPLTLVLRVEKDRSEEHTSELQSRENLVCRL